MGDLFDEIRRFDGVLSEAVAYHMQKKASAKTWIFYGFATDAPDRTAGDGSRINTTLFLDFYIVMRSGGKTQYTSDIRDITDVSDKLIHDVFSPNSLWTDDMRANMASMANPIRTRQPIDGGILSHLVRFEAKPQR